MATVATGSTAIVRQQGRLVHGSLAAEYYLSQPTPSQWLAVGFIGRPAAGQAGSRLMQLLMGIGETEEAAVSALRQRLAAFCRLVSVSGTSCAGCG
jgi:hypothetical protein